jgi:hypothetical protein
MRQMRTANGCNFFEVMLRDIFWLCENPPVPRPGRGTGGKNFR